MKIDSLDTLLHKQIRYIYDAEKRLLKAISKMAQAASSGELRAALLEHLDVTRNQVRRLEQIFAALRVPPKAKTCTGIKSIVHEGQAMLEQNTGAVLMDTAIIGAAQRVEHYQMAAYASARSVAEHLGDTRITGLLQETWDEERQAAETLAELAAQVLANAVVHREMRTAGASR